jgi:hypothetical protein
MFMYLFDECAFNVISIIVFLKDGVQEGLDVWRVKVEDRLP